MADGQGEAVTRQRYESRRFIGLFVGNGTTMEFGGFDALESRACMVEIQFTLAALPGANLTLDCNRLTRGESRQWLQSADTTPLALGSQCRLGRNAFSRTFANGLNGVELVSNFNQDMSQVELRIVEIPAASFDVTEKEGCR